jgi:hypothetical protein
MSSLSFKATHVYTGPTTQWGLQKNTDCIVVGRKLEARVIRRKDKREFLVPAHTIQKKEG